MCVFVYKENHPVPKGFITDVFHTAVSKVNATSSVSAVLTNIFISYDALVQQYLHLTKSHYV